MEEIWKDIKGYEGLYKVSNRGRVMSLKYYGGPHSQLLKLRKNRLGYMRVGFSVCGKHTEHIVAKLVADAFVPNPNNYKCVRYKDGNRDNIYADNLMWAARRDCSHDGGEKAQEIHNKKHMGKFRTQMYKELAEAAGGVLTEDKHMLIEENGEIVEKKYCSHCGEWKPLTEFGVNNNLRDGLHTYCYECQKERAVDYRKKRKANENNAEPTETEQVKELVVEKVVEVEVEKPTTAKDAFAVIMADFEAKDKEIARLKAELEKAKNSKDLGNLSERDIKYVLDNNRIVPRLLVEALTRYDDRYVFSAYDKVTGLTSTIKVEPQTA